MGIEGVLYDLDGTIADTRRLHEESWLYAGKVHGITITPRMLIDQKGIGGMDAARMMVPQERSDVLDAFYRTRKAKDNELYFASDLPLLPGFPEGYRSLQERQIAVGILTRTAPDQVEHFFTQHPELLDLKARTVHKGMLTGSKQEGLALASRLINVPLALCAYVGDAASDYQAAQHAGIHFIQVCDGQPDPGIPASIPIMRDHREILEIMKRL